MSEPINLMRCETGDFFRGDPDSEKWRGETVTWWKAMPAAEYAALTARVARLEAALREIAGRGPKDDPCAAEYGADGKRRDQFGSEASWCTFTSDESQEESAHASDVEAYAAAKIARAALDEGSKT